MGSAPHPVLNGIDAAARDGFPFLHGKRVAILCNHTSLDRSGRHLISLITAIPEITVSRIFSPEHGITGLAEPGQAVNDSSIGSIPVISLYGKTSRPDPAGFKEIDLLLVDLQDIGCRCYTYSSTVLLTLDAAAEAEIPVMILDRCNPLDGDTIEGCLLDPALQSFVAKLPVPFRHGMTLGELMKYSQSIGALSPDLALEVTRVEGWSRSQSAFEVDTTWVNPSPNIRSKEAIALYPGTVLLEAANVSEGRGTDRPFTSCGAPWIDAAALCARVAESGAGLLTASACTFTPAGNPLYMIKHAEVECAGVHLSVVPTGRRNAHRFGMELLRILSVDYPTALVIDYKWLVRLLGTYAVTSGCEGGALSFERYWEQEADDCVRFAKSRRSSLLYQ